MSHNFKQRNEYQQPDGEVHGEWMEAAQKLLPVGVGPAIQLKDPRQLTNVKARTKPAVSRKGGRKCPITSSSGMSISSPMGKCTASGWKRPRNCCQSAWGLPSNLKTQGNLQTSRQERSRRSREKAAGNVP